MKRMVVRGDLGPSGKALFPILSRRARTNTAPMCCWPGLMGSTAVDGRPAQPPEPGQRPALGLPLRRHHHGGSLESPSPLSGWQVWAMWASFGSHG